MHAEIEQLNQRYAIADHLRFLAGPGGLALAQVRNRHATAHITLQGGQVLSFQPHGQAPVLFVSRHSRYQPGTPIRGGIPICWPWFGPHPNAADLPAHGFVRLRAWQVSDTAATPDDATQLRLELTDSPDTRRCWPHAFRLGLLITIGPALHVDLRIENTDRQPWLCTGALHSYLRVGDVSRITITGLEAIAYIDKVAQGALRTQVGSIRITEETDRIYLDTPATCTVSDPLLQRRLVIEKRGSLATVVWNPWHDKAQRLPDLGDDEYQQMICVEAANVADHAMQLAPGATHTLGTTIRVAADH
ncbi:D-hexose-6-phosphate mutarotase [Kallotenue papyrolyticum]|uniref:D-hexose-6-phosphate mutarotase n=1 Tax=Kallotenue papyrolyticum TaxID=1325125 RepID=UPI00047856E1|nr:D-hexose-6-phosphate mutarotase [Kallotenue papyrolyticum]